MARSSGRVLAERREVSVVERHADVLHVSNPCIQSELANLTLEKLLVELRHDGDPFQLVEIELSTLRDGTELEISRPIFL